MVPKFALYAISVFLALIGIRKWRERKWGYCTNTVRLNNKVAIVTGANSGIGYEIAKELASRSACVILACRNIELAKEAIDKIKRELGIHASLFAKELDLASLESVKHFAEDVRGMFGEIHLLINNAGVAYPNKKVHLTENNLEIHFGVNHLGHFYLTDLLLDRIEASTPSRIVIVSSSLHEKGEVNLDDCYGVDLKKKPNLYANSKLANVYFGRELAKKAKNGVNVYIVCPGWVYTGLFRHSIAWYHYVLVAPIAFFFMRSPRQGAQTIIHCATDPDLSSESGLLYRDCKVYKSKVAFDDNIGRELWVKSEQIIEEKVKEISAESK